MRLHHLSLTSARRASPSTRPFARTHREGAPPALPTAAFSTVVFRVAAAALPSFLAASFSPSGGARIQRLPGRHGAEDKIWGMGLRMGLGAAFVAGVPSSAGSWPAGSGAEHEHENAEASGRGMGRREGGVRRDVCGRTGTGQGRGGNVKGEGRGCLGVCTTTTIFIHTYRHLHCPTLAGHRPALLHIASSSRRRLVSSLATSTRPWRRRLTAQRTVLPYKGITRRRLVLAVSPVLSFLHRVNLSLAVDSPSASAVDLQRTVPWRRGRDTDAY
ncbi:hypothetical protein MSAN_00967800 [Mycena sanguinolenta]|uniref:Uncharacterized protein n=1 Tax=Mycena sanguinolenta TaxID=230812 RepID=A0A8H6YYI9_9AGAR|nr:hypothetical protein MSAN_00967800 [Mycena sanguinolenta]